jgi:tRNA1(Val) A37 N6-methylase TrmN6
VGWPEGALTDDAFLNGRVAAWQPAQGFRAGLDSVLLAAAANPQVGATVFDLGIGAGVASLCLLARRPDLRVEGLEIDPNLAALAAANAARNGWGERMRVHAGDALHLPKDVPRQAYDHVITNPPFLLTGAATAGPEASKARAIALDPEAEARWFKSALALLKPKGALTVIHRADALGRLLGYLSPGTGDVAILPLHPVEGAPATRIVVAAKKGSRAALRILAGVVLHRADGRFTAQIERILREGAALSTSSE